MLSSDKAYKIAISKSIEDQIRDTALRGEFKISFANLTKATKDFLIMHGYKITTIVYDDVIRYDISWDKL